MYVLVVFFYQVLVGFVIMVLLCWLFWMNMLNLISVSVVSLNYVSMQMKWLFGNVMIVSLLIGVVDFDWFVLMKYGVICLSFCCVLIVVILCEYQMLVVGLFDCSKLLIGLVICRQLVIVIGFLGFVCVICCLGDIKLWLISMMKFWLVVSGVII